MKQYRFSCSSARPRKNANLGEHGSFWLRVSKTGHREGLYIGRKTFLSRSDCVTLSIVGRRAVTSGVSLLQRFDSKISPKFQR